mmetsp:Transcript_19062/g.59981  ORF Transcript_19062/g.59981 Transcript_19062/m.59981 type:complete len:210 (-) Transcript_19062:188-817(-)
MLVTLSLAAYALVPARWPTASATARVVPPAARLESIDGTFARSKARSQSNSEFCGMMRPNNFVGKVVPTSPTASLSEPSPASPSEPSPASLSVSSPTKHVSSQCLNDFARSKSRTAANSVFCGMIPVEATPDIAGPTTDDTAAEASVSTKQATKLESMDGKFGRSMKRTAANSVFCGMVPVEGAGVAPTRADTTDAALPRGIVKAWPEN